jgi:hypothetical protein
MDYVDKFAEEIIQNIITVIYVRRLCCLRLFYTESSKVGVPKYPFVRRSVLMVQRNVRSVWQCSILLRNYFIEFTSLLHHSQFTFPPRNTGPSIPAAG